MKLRSTFSLTIAALCISSAALAEESLDQTVDHFVKVLPPDPAVDRSAVVEKELARLAELNPRREADIRPILSAYEDCLRPAVDAATQRLLRSTARSLGIVKVAKLVQFYSGSDYQTYARLAAKADHGKALSAPEAASLDRINRSYPLIEFTQAFQSAQGGIINDQIFVQAATKCSLDKRSSFVRSNLRF